MLHFWSLGVEEQFYFVWPLLIVAVGFVLVAKLAWQRAPDRTYLLVVRR